jgi:hypothetical protein
MTPPEVVREATRQEELRGYPQCECCSDEPVCSRGPDGSNATCRWMAIHGQDGWERWKKANREFAALEREKSAAMWAKWRENHGKWRHPRSNAPAESG